MPSRPGLNAAAIIDAAARLADTVGPFSFTLKDLADALGVRPPSLYNHVASLDAIHQGLTLRALQHLTDLFRHAAMGRSGPAALRALAHAERRYAREHPGLFAALNRSAERQTVDIQQAAHEALEVLLTALSGYGLAGTAAIHAARMVRAAITGFVTLEVQGGFGLPEDVDASFEWMLTTLDTGLQAAAPASRRQDPGSDPGS